MELYIKKPIPVSAKIFEKGDEEGINEQNIPFINTLEGRALQADFGKHYLVKSSDNNKWLVEKNTFENTYAKCEGEKLFYRVCNSVTEQGLWYNPRGTFAGLIHNMFDFCKNKDLKMDFDPELIGWLSATDSLSELFGWFPIEDIKKLQKFGWHLHVYNAKDYRFYDRFQHFVINQNTSTLVTKLTF